MDIEQAINISKGCVMASFMDSETKQAVIEALNSVAISKTETTSCEWCEICKQYMGKMIDSSYFVFCPHCGRNLKGG